MEDDVAALAQHGIDVLVSLLGEDEEIELGLEHEASVCSRHNIEFLALPVPDLGKPIDSDAFIQSVHRLAVSARGGRSIAVHCRQSVGRSGLLAVSIVLASGLPLDSALDVVSRARGVRVPETNEQIDWLRRNVVRLSGLR